jgi:schlafen family protein
MPEQIQIHVADSLMLNDEDIARLRRSSEDHFVERKSYGDWKKDARKTVVAFANSINIGERGYLFIGVKDDGAVEQRSENLDSIQKTLAEELRLIYPRVVYETKALTEGGYQYLVVTVQGSPNRPHFAGPAYVRVGSTSVDASEEQFKQLIALRQSKVRRLLEWRGRRVTLEWVHRTAAHTQRSNTILTLETCDEFFVTLAGNDTKKSVPLGQVDLSYDHQNNQLKIEIVQ